MVIDFRTSFFRDVKKSPVELHTELDSIITQIENAKSLKEISNLKKLKGHTSAYRIRLNNYRLCFFTKKKELV